LATTNEPFDDLSHALPADEIAVHRLGDCVAARTAYVAFYEGRKLGLAL